jgi:hypothetical protein
MAQKPKNPQKKPPPPPMPIGRPTTYSQEMADKICEQVADGKSIRTICAGDDMPAVSSIFKWIRDYPEFSEQYRLAKEDCADAMAEDCIDIIDNQVEQPLLVEGIPMAIDGKMVMVKDNVSVSHAKERVAVRLKLMSKLMPKKYGDKLELGGDPNNPIQTVTRIELCAPSCPPLSK